MSKEAQVVVITGAAQGIGRAIAARFHEGGAKLALLDIRPDLFRGWATEWGPEILLINCNITRKAEVEAARDQVLARWGRIDVLVNNAGILPPRAPLESVKEEDWRQVIDVLLTGTFLCTQAFGAPMLDRGGAIVNISSIAGLFPSPTRGAYSASKAAVVLLTQQTALEWGPRKVRANAV
jgi:NAD(P)-dependent dehydrogenase (short-subunit alcohol dehydrogenase family)